MELGSGDVREIGLVVEPGISHINSSRRECSHFGGIGEHSGRIMRRAEPAALGSGIRRCPAGREADRDEA